MSSVETNESKTASEREGEQWACLPVSCSVILHKNLIYCSSSIAIENQYEGQNFTVYLFLIVLLIPACLPPTVITVLPTKYIADWRWLLIWLKNQVVVVVSGTAHGAPGVGRLPVLLSVRTHVQPGLAAPVQTEGVGGEAEVAVAVVVPVHWGRVDQLVRGGEVSVVIIPALGLWEGKGQG